MTGEIDGSGRLTATGTAKRGDGIGTYHLSAAHKDGVFRTTVTFNTQWTPYADFVLTLSKASFTE